MSTLSRAIAFGREANWITRRSILLFGLFLAWLSASFLLAMVFGFVIHGPKDGGLGDDFILFWSSARLAISGQANLAYDPGSFRIFRHAYTGPSTHYRIYVYPPTALLLSLSLGLLSYVPALSMWLASGAGAFIALLRRHVGGRLAAIATLGAPAAFLNLVTGQNGYFTAALFAGGIMCLDRSPTAAGICFGFLSYKPHIAALLPIALAVDGRWRAIGAAAATSALLLTASLVVFGTGAWAGFLSNAEIQEHLLEHYSSFWLRMPTVFAAMRIINAPVPLAYIAQAISALLALGIVVKIWRLRVPVAIKGAALGVSIFLAMPHAFDYDEVLLIFVGAWLACEGLRTGFLPWERLGILVLFISPLAVLPVAVFLRVQLGPLILWPFLLLLLRRCLHQSALSNLPGRVALVDNASFAPD